MSDELRGEERNERDEKLDENDERRCGKPDEILGEHKAEKTPDAEAAPLNGMAQQNEKAMVNDAAQMNKTALMK